MTSPRILQPKSTYTIDYPVAIEFAEQQQEIFWLANEIEVEKDLHDLKTNFTESERHGVVTTLKLFTLYELFVGNEYWGDVVMKKFPRPDIQRMASCFSFFELNVHAPFYDKLNKVLGLSTDEFYTSYVKNPVLKSRMSWIEKQIANKDLLTSLGVFSMIEGAVLYSSFAFLKHFQAEGKNKLVNVTAGINFSIRDEDLHSQAGAWLYRTLLEESNLKPEKLEKLNNILIKAAEQIREHEFKIIDLIFEKGNIKGITDLQLKNFVESRIDKCLERLSIEKQYKPTYNPVAGWFYRNINSSLFHDFFVKQGNAYNRDWVKSKFIW